MLQVIQITKWLADSKLENEKSTFIEYAHFAIDNLRMTYLFPVVWLSESASATTRKVTSVSIHKHREKLRRHVRTSLAHTRKDRENRHGYPYHKHPYIK